MLGEVAAPGRQQLQEQLVSMGRAKGAALGADAALRSSPYACKQPTFSLLKVSPFLHPEQGVDDASPGEPLLLPLLRQALSHGGEAVAAGAWPAEQLHGGADLRQDARLAASPLPVQRHPAPPQAVLQGEGSESGAEDGGAWEVAAAAPWATAQRAPAVPGRPAAWAIAVEESEEQPPLDPAAAPQAEEAEQAVASLAVRAASLAASWKAGGLLPSGSFEEAPSEEEELIGAVQQQGLREAREQEEREQGSEEEEDEGQQISSDEGGDLQLSGMVSAAAGDGMSFVCTYGAAQTPQAKDAC